MKFRARRGRRARGRPAHAGSGLQHAPDAPLRGVLVPGKSLAGIELGDPEQRVLELWGRDYRLCQGCDRTTWLFTYPEPDSLGAAVLVRARALVAVFTLGAPAGWHSVHGTAAR